MTATLNVYGNVREYDTDIDVFGNVFEWVETTTPSQAGWITRPATRLAVPSEQNRVAMVAPQQRVWIARSDNE